MQYAVRARESVKFPLPSNQDENFCLALAADLMATPEVVIPCLPKLLRLVSAYPKIVGVIHVRCIRVSMAPTWTLHACRPCYMAVLYFEDGLDREPCVGGFEMRADNILQQVDGDTMA